MIEDSVKVQSKQKKEKKNYHKGKKKVIKKKDLSEKDIETWETYIKNPSDIYDKDKNNQKTDRKER